MLEFKDQEFLNTAPPAAFKGLRKSNRALCHVPVRLFENQKFLWHHAQGLNISNTGIRLASLVPLEKGTSVQMTFSLPENPKRHRVDGKVVWMAASPERTLPFHCGIAFDNLKKISLDGRHLPPFFMGDRMCDFVVKLTPADLNVRPVRTLNELKNTFKLAYREYFLLGYCDENDDKMHYSTYNLLPTSRTFILRKKRTLLGTISLITESPCGFPMESTFSSLINKLRRQNRKLAEVSLLTIDSKAFRKKNLALTDHHRLTGSFWLFKTLLDYARHVAGITDLLITVHPKHEKLYQNFAFKPLGRPVPYHHAKGSMGLPMHLDITKLEKYLPRGKSFQNFFFEKKSPQKLLTQSYECSPDALQELLSKKRRSWGEMSSRFSEYFHAKFLSNIYHPVPSENFS